MPYQNFRVVDGKIIEEDEATFQEREKKVLDGIKMPVSYFCLICNVNCTKEGPYNHWKTFHSDKKPNDGHSVDENSETGKAGDEFTERSMIREDERVTRGKEEPSCETTISVSPKPVEEEDEEWDIDVIDYSKDIFTVKTNVIYYENMDFKISPSSEKELPQERCCMQEIKSNLPDQNIEDLCGCDRHENLETPQNLDFFPMETSDSLEREDWGPIPMPELLPQCSPSYDKQVDDNNNDAEEDMTERRPKPEMGKKRRPMKKSKLSGPMKKSKLSGPMTRANLYDAMRRGERLWWCKKCDDYLKSVELLKYHVAKVHNEDMSKINRFNIATWDLEIARTFTSPHEIELEYQLDLLVPDNDIEQLGN